MPKGLKPCPFCGGKHLRFFFHKLRGEAHEYAVGGYECLAVDCGQTVQWYFSDPDEWNEKSAQIACAYWWNRRASDAQGV